MEWNRIKPFFWKYGHRELLHNTRFGDIGDNVREWFSKAYANVTEIAERPLLCDPRYFNIYLTWTNFIVRFALPTIILIGCNFKILHKVE